MNFTCSVCNLKFQVATELGQHIKSHVQEVTNLAKDEFQCELCDELFNDERILKDHITNVHDETEQDIQEQSQSKRNNLKELKCSQCEKSFIGSLDLVIHNERHHEPLSYYECSFCKKQINNRKDMQRHLKTNHDFSVGTNSLVKLYHPEGYTPEKNTKLQQRKVKNSNTNGLDSTKKRVTRGKCNICNETFSKTSLFRTHKKEVHGDKKIFECSFCGQCFTTATSLSKHRKKNHAFSCNRCVNKFVNKLQLRVHKRIHKGEKREKVSSKVKCKVCRKTLANQTCFKQHMLVVHKDEQFAKVSCEICDKKFLYEHFKTTHIKIEHEGFRETCELCDKTFAQKGALKLHVTKIHAEIAK